MPTKETMSAETVRILIEGFLINLCVCLRANVCVRETNVGEMKLSKRRKANERREESECEVEADCCANGEEKKSSSWDRPNGGLYT